MNSNRTYQTPKLADMMLDVLCKDEWIEPIKGDLQEQFISDYERIGPFRSRLRYWINMFHFLRPFALKKTMSNSNNKAMFKNHLKLSWRNLKNQKLFTTINLVGLVLSTIVCLNIYLFIKDELSYDIFHKGYQDSYRVAASIKSGGIFYHEATSQFPMASALKSSFPEVEIATRIFRPLQDPLMSYGENKYIESGFLFVDSSFFDHFGFELIAGDKKNALRNQNSVVITERIAQKYFGELDPLGKILKYNDQQSLEVSGVVRNTSINSHIKFDFISPLQLQLSFWRAVSGSQGRENKWFWTGAWTYIKLAESTNRSEFVAKLPQFVTDHFPAKWRDESYLTLQRIDEIHLTSDRNYEIEPNGSLSNVKVFGIIGLILMIIAIINFVNLILAQSINRTKQIGISRNLGASRTGIASQIIIETIVVCITAGVLGLLITYFTVPVINSIIDKSIDFSGFLTTANLVIYFLIFIFIGFVAGLYPSYYLSDPVKTNILGYQAAGSKRSIIKETLLGMQFIASVVLIISVIIISAQREYIYTKNIGFDKDNMLIVKARQDVNKQYEAFKSELEKHPEVIKMTGIREVPGQGLGSWRFVPEGGNHAEPELLPHTFVGYDFLSTADIELTIGRFFDKAHPADIRNAFVLNKEAVKQLGWEENPIGKSLELFAPGQETIMKKGQVIGVIENYHFESLHHPLKPAIFSLTPNFGNYMIKFNTNDFGELISKLESSWAQFSEKWPLEYYLLDEELSQLYSREEKLSSLINVAVGIALIIACIGIFGLSSFMIANRTKEVGIRRVLGISTNAIVYLLSKNFLLIVLIANVLAWPIAYIAMSSWLSNFEYAVSIEWAAFAISALVTLLVAFGITCFHALKTASINPVKSLRYE